MCLERNQVRRTRRSFLKRSVGVPFALSQRLSRGSPALYKSRGELRAGGASSNITPPLGVSLDDTIFQVGPATHVHDELFARCLVLDDGRTRVGFAICDVSVLSDLVVTEVKKLVLKRTGIPGDQLIVAATHTHSAPTVLEASLSGIPWPRPDPHLHSEYAQFLTHRIADGVQRACNRLEPAEIGWGSTDVDQFVYNRRWHVKPGARLQSPFGQTEDVQSVPPWTLWPPPPRPPAMEKPAGPVDPGLSVMAIRSKSGRLLCVLANYSTHPAGFRMGWDAVTGAFVQESGIPRGHVSADLFGKFSRHFQRESSKRGEDTGLGILSNGTCGDVEPIDRRRPPVAESYGLLSQAGKTLAREALRVREKLTFQDKVNLQARSDVVSLKVRLPHLEEVGKSRAILERAESGELSRDEVFARETILVSRYPPRYRFRLQLVRVGDVGIVALPGEAFAETGLQIKAESPLGLTFIIGLANGYAGQMPPPPHYRLGGLETWRCRSSFLEQNAEPKVVERVRALLKELA